jgi:hypothetical protein
MVNRSKNIGTAGETAVVRWLQHNGWPTAERRALAGSADLGDIVGTPGLCWEVKAGKAAEASTDGSVACWQNQTDAETKNSGADLGVLVCKRKGVAANVGRWWAWMRASDVAYLRHGEPSCGMAGESDAPDPWVRLTVDEAIALLRHAGYGTPLEEAA